MRSNSVSLAVMFSILIMFSVCVCLENVFASDVRAESSDSICASTLTLFQLFTPVISLIKSNMAVPVLGGAVVCTGELCQSLVLSAVPEIPKFMPAILKVLADVELVKA